LAATGTSDIDVENNTSAGCYYGWLDDAVVGHYADVTVANNRFLGAYSAAFAVNHQYTGGSWRAWGNTTQAGQVVQNLNGAVTVDASGNIVSPANIKAASFSIGVVSLPAQSSGTQTAGQVACVKSLGPPVLIGTCAGTVSTSTGACGTCN
jgi:hypothetical protein